MHRTSFPSPLFAPQARSAFGKLAVTGFFGAGLMAGLLAFIIGFPSNTALLIVTLALLVCAGLGLTPFRWVPLVLTVLGAIFLYQIARQPFVVYHLTNPKTGGFLEFVLDVLITALVFVALGASIGAGVQNYRAHDTRAPRWLPSALTGVAGIVIGAILIAAIAKPGSAVGTSYTNGVPTIQLSAGNFDQSSVTIAKGAKLLFVEDVAVLHILANGFWQNGVAHGAKEPGAPSVNNIQVNGNSAEIGPFMTAGTFRLFCPLHQGMNLTVTVQ